MNIVAFTREHNSYYKDVVGITDALSSCGISCHTFSIDAGNPVFSILEHFKPTVLMVAEGAMSKAIPLWLQENPATRLLYFKSKNRMEQTSAPNLEIYSHDVFLPAINLLRPRPSTKKYLLGYHGLHDRTVLSELEKLTSNFKVFGSSVWRTPAYAGDISKSGAYRLCKFVYNPKIKIEDYFEIVQEGAIPVCSDYSLLPGEFLPTTCTNLTEIDNQLYIETANKHNYHTRAMELFDGTSISQKIRENIGKFLW